MDSFPIGKDLETVGLTRPIRDPMKYATRLCSAPRKQGALATG
jgi:hypothetical protein